MYLQTPLGHARDKALLYLGSASHPAALSSLEVDDPSRLTDTYDFSHAAACALLPGSDSLSSVGKVCHPRRRSSFLMTDETPTLPEVAKLLKATDKTVYTLAPMWVLPAFKVASRWRFKRVDAWIEERAPNEDQS
jgi:predicted DNA-binding transcriptional regulator AlpA